MLHNEPPVPIANVTLAPDLDSTNVFLELRDDAGLIAVTAAPWSMVGTVPVPLSLITTAADGSTVTRLDDVVSLSPDRFSASKNEQGHGPAIDRLGNGSFLVRLLDDVATPHEGWAALIDRDGGVVRTWTDQAILHAERVDERLVLLRAPLARDDLARSVVVDILDAATGATIALGLDTPWRSSDVATLDHQVFAAAAHDNGVDLAYAVQIPDPDLGYFLRWTYTKIRAGQLPRVQLRS